MAKLKRGSIVVVRQDSNAESPRDFENLGEMICFHGKYNLGDNDHNYKASDYNGWSELEAAITKDFPGGVILPLYLYDHSGITMNTTGFSCPWDSGQVGFIVASAANIRECYAVKRLTAKVRSNAKASLVHEVETYDQYLRNDVYSYEIVSPNGTITDSCGGFYGSDPVENRMVDHVPVELHGLLKEAAANPLYR